MKKPPDTGKAGARRNCPHTGKAGIVRHYPDTGTGGCSGDMGSAVSNNSTPFLAKFSYENFCVAFDTFLGLLVYLFAAACIGFLIYVWVVS